MAEQFVKYTFYLMYLIAGAIISYFLPENARYWFGWFFALLTAWNWKMINKKKEVHHG